jgi:hypothetical protein
MQIGRDDPTIHRQDRLDQAAYPGGPFEMSTIRLDRTDEQRRGATGEHGAECTGLDRVADRGAGTVCLEEADFGRLHAGITQRGADHRLLRRAARHREAARPAVVVGGTAPQQG